MADEGGRATYKLSGYLKAHEIKQSEVAAVLGISLSNTNKKIRHKVEFKASEIEAIHTQFQIPYDVFFG
ncbi:MAG: hypothetical protein DUD32_01480 [Lactobacillus sp.]|nr:MAG: hypothetical protein DUD32_01480 [Lactobacillus sp.]